MVGIYRIEGEQMDSLTMPNIGEMIEVRCGACNRIVEVPVERLASDAPIQGATSPLQIASRKVAAIISVLLTGFGLTALNKGVSSNQY